ncbi:Sulfotransferase family protein [Pseudoxanthomonas sp. GM95]|uniref:tetratricopeptide repeat-containing sulfotransferase family protein n=1 Tax=Pseudoxanthomonas sp. GM95 TaxID=1881043 RepID=UPI0008AE62D4|nr:sulfotransferase [Pseudoxanthomonas sp. GM95]SEK86949.1 Sulfotransferase family protein [Pseudoxanthomonas sp. GM95]
MSDVRSEAALRSRYAEAVDALNRRNWGAAKRLAESLLSQAPSHGGVHFILGMATMELREIKTAFGHLMQATKLSPSRSDYAAQFARILFECRMQPQAIAEAERSLSLGNHDPMTLNVLAVLFTRANAHAQAATAFELAVKQLPAEAGLRLNLATSLLAIGEIKAAISECEHALSINPKLWRAHLVLAQLSKQEAEENHVERLRTLLEVHSADPEAALYLNLALEKELDDLRQYQPALTHLIAGKRAWRKRMDFSQEPDAQIFDSIIRACGPLPEKIVGASTAEPIFIFGMPRSGTTLVERIVSSHSAVHSAGELQAFPVMYKRAVGVPSRLAIDTPMLGAMGRVDWTALGEAYLENTRPLTGHTPHFIDKLPHNFMFAGLIARALPNAKMICLRRDATDTCIANFRQLFALNSPNYNYCFDLLDTGRYWLLFDRLMQHFQSVMPGRILEVRYEDVVNDQEGQTRRLLEHCGLPWEDACLQFEKNAAPVSTASAVQVRSKIYRSSLQRWKRYGPMVDDLRALLAEGGARIGD